MDFARVWWNRLRIGLWEHRSRVAALVVPTVIFGGAVLWKGTPSVRHDWFWIDDRSDLLRNLVDAFNGWTSAGIGQPQLHATMQLQIATSWILTALAGSRLAFGIEVVLIGLVCAFAGARLAAAFADDAVTVFGSATFAALNPWTYTEVVAGHTSMIAAYGGLLLLTRYLLEPRPNRYAVALSVMLCSIQLQFFLPVLVVLAVAGVTKREFRLGLATGMVLFLPAVVGVIGDRTAYVEVPRNLVWLQSQSVDALEAATMRGYFAHYTASLGQPMLAALWIVVLIAAVGGAFALGRKWLALLPALAAFALLVVVGLKGPLGGLLVSGFDRVPALGVYRELYDVVAFLAVGYVALGGLACARIVGLRWLWSLCACTIAAYWFTAPPSHFWVGIDAIPRPGISAQIGTRFALLPGFQPLSFRGQGSGLDPAAYLRAGDIAPLNVEAPSYPIDVALARYEQQGDVTDLAAVSVSDVVVQPWMKSLTADLDRQRAVKTPTASVRPATRSVPGYLPMISLAPLPHLSAVGNHLGYGEALFSDVAGLSGEGVPSAWAALPGIRTIDVSHDRMNASDGWVDVRTAFASQPELGQGIGGVLTTSPRALLPVDDRQEALVFVRGALLDAKGRRIATTTEGYTWAVLPHGTTALRCRGECVVAAQGDVPGAVGTERPVRSPWTPVAAKTMTPWLVVATVPASVDPRMLRYNVRFDASWIALDGASVLPHFRVDTTVNGWVVAPRAASRRIVVLEPTAMLQTFAAFIGVLWSLGVIIRFVRDAYADRSRRRPDPRTNRAPGTA